MKSHPLRSEELFFPLLGLIGVVGSIAFLSDLFSMGTRMIAPNLRVIVTEFGAQNGRVALAQYGGPLLTLLALTVLLAFWFLMPKKRTMVEQMTLIAMISIATVLTYLLHDFFLALPTLLFALSGVCGALINGFRRRKTTRGDGGN